VTPVLALLAGAVALWPGPSRRAALRLGSLGRLPDRVRSRATGRLPDRVRRWALAASAALSVGLLLGGALGVGAGLAVLVLVERALRRDSVAAHSEDGPLIGDLPSACDLLAVCLTAGVPLPAALAAVGGAVPGVLGGELDRVGGLVRLGADAGRAWRDAAPALEPLARILRRSATSGARAAPALNALAAELRAAARAETEAAVQRAGVRVLAPLGLCFLPAFVCLGVVPMVIGIAGDVLG
jgi:pilus assembly protein TadC